MIREHLFHKRLGADPLFRWRGGEISRMEGLSDGVFAVTLTLLAFSLNTPKTFYELWLTIKEIPAFLVCFFILMRLWRYHFLFFRRYGLDDALTSFLNSALLFFVLCCAYPLKFLVTFIWKLILREDVQFMFSVPEGVAQEFGLFFQRAGMLYFFGFGVLCVFAVLALMLWRAFALRERLQLDKLERFLTIASLRSHLITLCVAVISLVVLASGAQPGIAGVVYFALFFIHPTHHILNKLTIAKIARELKLDERPALA